jgi:hypothetical protein
MESATTFPTIAIKVKPTGDGGFVVEVNPKSQMAKEVERPLQRMIGASGKRQQLCFD